MIRSMFFAAALLAGVAAPAADAAIIVLVDKGGVQGSAADRVYRTAAAYWGSMLTNDITIRFGVEYHPLGYGVLGQAGPTSVNYSLADWQTGLAATRSNSILDRSAVLPTLTNGAASFITSAAGPGGLGIDTSRQVYDTDTTGIAATNNNTLSISTALVRAIGGVATYEPDNTDQIDGRILFNSAYDAAFDFDPTDGIPDGAIDFTQVVVHEMGHALGFISGLEYYDYYGAPNGGGQADGQNVDWNARAVFTPLDMFRYSDNPAKIAPADDAVLDLSVGTPAYFSVDGGKTALFGNHFATGAGNGDGTSPSHWQAASGCQVVLGIMHPYACPGDGQSVTALDIAAFDAIGYNIRVDALADNGSYRITTAQIATMFGGAVPEPATWMMMITGFGLVGGLLRRRRPSAGTYEQPSIGWSGSIA